MSERQETVHVVMRRMKGDVESKPTRVADDRADARKYAKRMNSNPRARYVYAVQSCKKL